MISETGPLHVNRAVHKDELREAYRLVHSTFVDHGYIRPQKGCIRVRIFETLPHMATFVAKDDSEHIVGVMSLLPDMVDYGVPSNKVFGDELDKIRMQGRFFGEITNLAVDPEYSRSNAFFKLTQSVHKHSISIGLDDLFIAISHGHAAFFEEILSFCPCGGIRDCGCGVVDMVEGKRLDLKTFESHMKEEDKLLGDQAFLHDWYFTDRGIDIDKGTTANE